ncbi:hypothetical protein [Bradyrhizobium sp. B117]|uniref:hypothetical protein n=1 Tax=Bradyrhizobium sp. B117 TaxID=3140246 RepID=UPI0031843F91
MSRKITIEPRAKGYQQHEQGEPEQDADRAAGSVLNGLSGCGLRERCGAQDTDDGDDEQAEGGHRRLLLGILRMPDMDEMNQLGALVELKSV